MASTAPHAPFHHQPGPPPAGPAQPSPVDSGQYRVDPTDGYVYPLSSFIECYGEQDGLARWNKAARMDPDPVGGLGATCSAPSCDKDSCVYCHDCNQVYCSYSCQVHAHRFLNLTGHTRITFTLAAAKRILDTTAQGQSQNGGAAYPSGSHYVAPSALSRPHASLTPAPLAASPSAAAPSANGASPARSAHDPTASAAANHFASLTYQRDVAVKTEDFAEAHRLTETIKNLEPPQQQQQQQQQQQLAIQRTSVTGSFGDTPIQVPIQPAHPLDRSRDSLVSQGSGQLVPSPAALGFQLPAPSPAYVPPPPAYAPAGSQGAMTAASPAAVYPTSPNGGVLVKTGRTSPSYRQPSPPPPTFSSPGPFAPNGSWSM